MKGWCECIKATKEEEEKREMARCEERGMERGSEGKMNHIEVFYKYRLGFCWYQCELHVGVTGVSKHSVCDGKSKSRVHK